jgi:demethylmenaquinone methyltransferase/2-methoxy-6-polyprenyl-1,4-benzoquinol methylase
MAPAPLTVGPDNHASIARYARHAAGYDASARRTMGLRLRTIALLDLQPGDVVLDVGAGTGLSLEPLQRAVGEGGCVLAFEQSPHMAERAEQRVRQAGWRNVWLARAAAEDVRLPRAPDAALFNYVHDITRSPRAVHNLLSQLRPGARIAMAGMKYFPWWMGPLNLLPWMKNRPYNVHPADLWRPWDLVQPWCVDFRWWSTQCGMGYIAQGRLRAAPPEPPPALGHRP